VQLQNNVVSAAIPVIAAGTNAVLAVYAPDATYTFSMVLASLNAVSVMHPVGYALLPSKDWTDAVFE
jgi:hypothetical protein